MERRVTKSAQNRRVSRRIALEYGLPHEDGGVGEGHEDVACAGPAHGGPAAVLEDVADGDEVEDDEFFEDALEVNIELEEPEVDVFDVDVFDFVDLDMDGLDVDDQEVVDEDEEDDEELEETLEGPDRAERVRAAFRLHNITRDAQRGLLAAFDCDDLPRDPRTLTKVNTEFLSDKQLVGANTYAFFKWRDALQKFCADVTGDIQLQSPPPHRTRPLALLGLLT
jgi:hypothetical protein